MLQYMEWMWLFTILKFMWGKWPLPSLHIEVGFNWNPLQYLLHWSGGSEPLVKSHFHPLPKPLFKSHWSGLGISRSLLRQHCQAGPALLVGHKTLRWSDLHIASGWISPPAAVGSSLQLSHCWSAISSLHWNFLYLFRCVLLPNSHWRTSFLFALL